MSSFNGYKGILFLLTILILGLILGNPLMRYIEGFSNANGDPLLDSFPSTGEKNVNDNTYNKIWWKYPIFPVGSFNQITNNLRYRRNPDDDNCDGGTRGVWTVAVETNPLETGYVYERGRTRSSGAKYGKSVKQRAAYGRGQRG